jgi:hypothetical protein
MHFTSGLQTSCNSINSFHSSKFINPREGEDQDFAQWYIQTALLSVWFAEESMAIR